MCSFNNVQDIENYLKTNAHEAAAVVKHCLAPEQLNRLIQTIDDAFNLIRIFPDDMHYETSSRAQILNYVANNVNRFDLFDPQVKRINWPLNLFAQDSKAYRFFVERLSARFEEQIKACEMPAILDGKPVEPSETLGDTLGTVRRLPSEEPAAVPLESSPRTADEMRQLMWVLIPGLNLPVPLLTEEVRKKSISAFRAKKLTFPHSDYQLVINELKAYGSTDEDIIRSFIDNTWGTFFSCIKHRGVLVECFPEQTDFIFNSILKSKLIFSILKSQIELGDFIDLFPSKKQAILDFIFKPEVMSLLRKNTLFIQAITYHYSDDIISRKLGDYDNYTCFTKELQRNTVFNDEDIEAGPRNYSRINDLIVEIAEKTLSEPAEILSLNTDGEVIVSTQADWSSNLSVALHYAEFDQLQLSSAFQERCMDFFTTFTDVDQEVKNKPLGKYAIFIYTREYYYRSINQLLRGLAVEIPDAEENEHLYLKFIFLISLVCSAEINSLRIEQLNKPRELDAQQLFRNQDLAPPMGFYIPRGLTSAFEQVENCHEYFPKPYTLRFSVFPWMVPSVSEEPENPHKNEHILCHGTPLRTTSITYPDGLPSEFNLEISHSPNSTGIMSSEYAYFIRQALRSVHRDILSKPYSNGDSRSNHDTYHVIRTLSILQELVAYLKKHANDQIKPLIEDMTYDDMFWVKLALIFFITGRDGEESSQESPERYSAYKKASSAHYMQYIKRMQEEYPSTLLPEALQDRKTQEFLVELLAYSDDPSPYLAGKTGKPLLIAVLVHVAHSLDLIRCYSGNRYDEAVSKRLSPFVYSSIEQEGDLRLLKTLARLYVEETKDFSCDDKTKSNITLAELNLSHIKIPAYLKRTAILEGTTSSNVSGRNNKNSFFSRLGMPRKTSTIDLGDDFVSCLLKLVEVGIFELTQEDTSSVAELGRVYEKREAVFEERFFDFLEKTKVCPVAQLKFFNVFSRDDLNTRVILGLFEKLAQSGVRYSIILGKDEINFVKFFLSSLYSLRQCFAGIQDPLECYTLAAFIIKYDVDIEATFLPWNADDASNSAEFNFALNKAETGTALQSFMEEYEKLGRGTKIKCLERIIDDFVKHSVIFNFAIDSVNNPRLVDSSLISDKLDSFLEICAYFNLFEDLKVKFYYLDYSNAHIIQELLSKLYKRMNQATKSGKLFSTEHRNLLNRLFESNSILCISNEQSSHNQSTDLSLQEARGFSFTLKDKTYNDVAVSTQLKTYLTTNKLRGYPYALIEDKTISYRDVDGRVVKTSYPEFIGLMCEVIERNCGIDPYLYLLYGLYSKKNHVTHYGRIYMQQLSFTEIQFQLGGGKEEQISQISVYVAYPDGVYAVVNLSDSLVTKLNKSLEEACCDMFKKLLQNYAARLYRTLQQPSLSRDSPEGLDDPLKVLLPRVDDCETDSCKITIEFYLSAYTTRHERLKGADDSNCKENAIPIEFIFNSDHYLESFKCDGLVPRENFLTVLQEEWNKLLDELALAQEAKPVVSGVSM